MLTGAAALIDPLNALGAALLAQAPLAAAVALLVGLGSSIRWLIARPWLAPGSAEIAQLCGALGIAALAQTAMLAGWLVAGSALYAVALAVQLLWRSDTSAPRIRLGRPAEMLSIVLLFALATVLLLFRVDIYPHLLFDEEAYLVASRVWLEQIPAKSIAGPLANDLYRLERFETQPLPFGAQLLSVWLQPTGLHATRFASVAAAATALAVGLATLRNRLGVAAALGATSLWLVSPLFLSYGRSGLFVIFTILHAALCLAATLRFVERWDLRSALPLGLLLAASFYCYQLSWFVPVLVAIVLLTSAALYTRAGLRVVVAVGVVAAVGLMPALLLPREGFEQLFEHSRARAALGEMALSRPFALVLLPQHESRKQHDLAIGRAVPANVQVMPTTSQSGRRMIFLLGDKPDLHDALASPSAASWQVIAEPDIGIWRNVVHLIAQLFHQQSGLTDALRLRHSLLLPAPLVPLLVLGLAEAARRRREPLMRVLLVWAIAGLVLPPLLTGMGPRRVVLALPVLGALMMLPLATIAGRLWQGSGQERSGARSIARGAVIAGASAFWITAAAIGSHLFFERWEDLVIPGDRPPTVSRLELVELLRGIDTPVLMPAFDLRLAHHLQTVQRMNARRDAERIQIFKALDRKRVLQISCRQTQPFTWVTVDLPEYTALLDPLTAGFVLEPESRDGYRIYRVHRPNPGTCRANSP